MFDATKRHPSHPLAAARPGRGLFDPRGQTWAVAERRTPAGDARLRQALRATRIRTARMTEQRLREREERHRRWAAEGWGDVRGYFVGDCIVFVSRSSTARPQALLTPARAGRAPRPRARRVYRRR